MHSLRKLYTEYGTAVPPVYRPRGPVQTAPCGFQRDRSESSDSPPFRAVRALTGLPREATRPGPRRRRARRHGAGLPAARLGDSPAAPFRPPPLPTRKPSALAARPLSPLPLVQACTLLRCSVRAVIKGFKLEAAAPSAVNPALSRSSSGSGSSAGTRSCLLALRPPASMGCIVSRGNDPRRRDHCWGHCCCRLRRPASPSRVPGQRPGEPLHLAHSEP